MQQRFDDEYWPAWRQFVLHGTFAEEQLPALIIQSWRRCAACGLNPYASRGSVPVRPDRIRIPQDLLSLARPAIEDLYQFAEGAECVVLFADAEMIRYWDAPVHTAALRRGM